MTVLHAPPGSPPWLETAATTLLVLHIGGGAIGILSGAVALFSRKGGALHRAAGKVFFAAMLVAYLVAAGVAPFLDEGQRVNTVAGVMALYLLLSGWAAIRRPEVVPGALQTAGLFTALALVAAGAYFIYLAQSDPSGTIDKSPPQSFYVFIVSGTFAALGELHLLVRRSLTGKARVARHLWRMCFSLFIASGSFFLGQQKIMPQWLHDSPILLALAVLPLAFLVFWLLRVLLTNWARAVPAA